MLNISWSIEGDKQLSRRLRRISNDVEDWSDTFEAVGQKLTDSFSGEVFDTEGSAIGEPWAALSLATLMEKDSEGYGEQPILVRTGNMRRSFEYRASRFAGVVYNAADYFKYHQSNRQRNSNLPRRVMMKLDNQRKEMVVRQFLTDYRKKINRGV